MPLPVSKLVTSIGRALQAWWQHRPQALGRYPVPSEDQIIRHLQAGAFWVEEHWRDPAQQFITLPTLCTVIHIGPGFVMRRKTRGHDWIPVGSYIHNLVACIVLTEETPDVP